MDETPARRAADSSTLEGTLRASLDSLRAIGREALQQAGLGFEGAVIVTEVQLEASTFRERFNLRRVAWGAASYAERQNSSDELLIFFDAGRPR